MNDSGKSTLSDFVSDRYRLMAFIRAMVRDHHAAEDIFQEVWLRLDDAVKRGVEIRSTSKWCRGVAKNLILHYWRDQKRPRVVADDELLGLVAAAFEEHDAAQEYWRVRESALRHCMEKLPQHSRQVLSLKYDTGLSIAAVAQRLGKTIAAVTKLLSRLRQKLRDCVAERLQLDGISP